MLLKFNNNQLFVDFEASWLSLNCIHTVRAVYIGGADIELNTTWRCLTKLGETLWQMWLSSKYEAQANTALACIVKPCDYALIMSA